MEKIKELMDLLETEKQDVSKIKQDLPNCPKQLSQAKNKIFYRNI